ncbi:MAG: UvrD-helicase domain-containing protein [Rubrivivax sp.]|nr:UvrD-helicase domain-containing protein [Rubrivivax sp.]
MTAPAYRIDGQPASAGQFYARACDPARSVAVEACAGAGKTWMLVSRILRALLAGTEPQQILAITYTRKAAGEMRSRLQEWLADFCAAHSTPAQREQALVDRGMTPRQAHEHADALGALHERLLLDGRAVEVRTFHAWFAQLLSHAPLALLEQLNLPAQYELLEDTQALQAELFKRLHRRVQANADLRADYIALVQRHRRGTVLDWLQAAWERSPELARADDVGAAETAVPPAAQIWPACAHVASPACLVQTGDLARDIAALAAELGKAKAAAAQQAARGLLAALAAATPEQALALAIDALYTKAGTPRKKLGDTPLQQAVMDGLQSLQDMAVQQRAHIDQLALLRLWRVLRTEYAALKRQRGLIDMPDLERAAETMLGDSVMAGWVQERLDQRLRHVLIDEFQDTNPLQWQVLQGWLSSYAGAGGGLSGQQPLALFIVGDPKQSIYRFRGAEPRVFEAARDFVVQAMDGSVLQCDHTRRNAPAVIEALNQVFESAAQQGAWGPYRTHTTDSVAHGHVLRLPGVLRTAAVGQGADPEVWRDSLTQPRTEAEQLLRAQEAQQVAAGVATLLVDHALQAGDVMVLSRKRSTLAHVAQALADAGIPHVVAEPLALHESPEALDLVAVLDVIASPGHDLSLARALRSPIFGASDDDLLWLSQQSAAIESRPKRAWLMALMDPSDEHAEPPSAELQRARRLLSRWRGLSLPPHDLLDQIVHQGDVLARVAAAVPAARRRGALHAVNALLAAALQHEGGRFSSVYGLVRALRAGRLRAPGVAPADAVQLLTVHGAKGLEARAVLVADADPERRKSLRAAVLVDWPVDRHAPRRVAFVRSVDEMAPSLRELWVTETAAQDREELNGLYVAMTRAREWLVFSRAEPHARDPGQPWWQRVEAHATAWEPQTQAAGAPPNSVDVVVQPTFQRLPAPATELQPPDDVTQDEAAARLGRAVHRVLEWAAGPLAAQTRAALPAAGQAAALLFGLPPRQAARVAQLASAVLDSAACRRFFEGPALRWAGNEVPVTWGGEALRIDRLVALQSAGETAPTWWVLDYKLQADPATVQAYRDQMLRYMAAVSALQVGEVVRGAFITGQGQVVEV